MDNAILAFGLAIMVYIRAIIPCSLYMVSVRVSSKLEATNYRGSGDFFSQRIEWRPKKIVLILRILELKCNFIGKKKHKQTKKPQEFV